MAHNLEQVLYSKGVEKLLEANGIADRKAGLDKFDGWKKLCKDLGWQDEGRTPAQEAYFDGYYKP